MAKTKEIHVKGFFLRSVGKKANGNLYYRVNREGVSLTICTGISVDVKKWRAATQSTAKWNDYTSEESYIDDNGNEKFRETEGSRVKRLMDDVIKAVKKLIESGVGKEKQPDGKMLQSDRDKFQKAVDNIVGKDSYDRNEEAEISNLNHILAFYEYFMKGITSGEIKHKGKRYEKSSVKTWRGFKHVLYGVVDPYMTFDKIDKRFVDKFTFYLDNLGVMQHTRNLYIASMRKLCSSAAEYGFNNNAMTLSSWKRKTPEKKEMKAAIYLTDEEIDALYEMPLEGLLATVRDMFFVGCMTCQRFSDYSELKRWDFHKNDYGVPVVTLTQKKTNKQVEIPIVDDRVEIVCERNNYRFPELGHQSVETSIKRIFKKLADSVPSLNDLYETNLTKLERQSEERYKLIQKKRENGERLTPKERSCDWWYREICMCPDKEHLWPRNDNGNVMKPKYALVSTHTARRSGITNLYNLGVLDNRELRSISGHQSDKTLDIYIKTTASEQAAKVFDKLMKKKEESKPDGKASVVRMKKAK